MAEIELHHLVVLSVFATGALTAAALLFVSAPYGRHVREGWGPSLPSRVGWIVMESPAVLLFAAIYASGAHRAETVPLVLLGMWQLHYVHRTFIFPFRMRATGKRMPILIPGMALIFNTVNAYINARWISHLGIYDSGWLRDPRFLAGAALFVLGWIINLHADSILFRLRKPGESGYKIPRGGLYSYVTSPNYFGELLEWIGFAVAAWSLAGAAFAFYTAANLIPRALTHRVWYRETFADFPRERKAIIPFVL